MSAIFSPKIFSFLTELTDNNNRAWFEANKSRYIDDVRDRLSQFIVEMSPGLDRLSKQIVADPRANGGSMFRIYRDVRFSKDKTPYKTHAAVHFRHVVEKDVHGPGLYFVIGLDECSIGGGIWHPATPQVRAIRAAIDAHQSQWLKIVENPSFVDLFGEIQGDTLKRVPKEYDPDHPLGEHLRLKDFYALHQFSHKDIISSDIIEQSTRVYENLAPLMGFLSKAVGLHW